MAGADQAEVLFQARRDNYLKVTASQYLNRDATMPLAAFLLGDPPDGAFEMIWVEMRIGIGGSRLNYIYFIE